MNKVAIVWRMDQPGGVQSCVISLIRGLNRRGIVPDILWDVEPDWQMLAEAKVDAGFYPISFRVPTSLMMRFPYTLRYLARMTCVVYEEQIGAIYDFIYSFYNGMILDKTPHMYYLSGPPLIPQLRKGNPVSRLLTCSYEAFLHQMSPVFEYHRQSRYFINSHFTAELFREAHGVNLPVVHPPIDLSDRDFEQEDLPERNTITYFSRIAEYKRPDMVLRLAQHYPEYRVTIMGGLSPNRVEYFNHLKRFAEAENLENVIFLVNATEERVREELRRTRFYIFPGINEHFGMTTPEAIASGAVPFVHNSGGQVEIVPDARLRFEDNNFLEKFDAMQKMPMEELVRIRIKLLAHVNGYTEEIYIEKMLSCLDDGGRRSCGLTERSE